MYILYCNSNFSFPHDQINACFFDGKEELSFDELYCRADSAMYESNVEIKNVVSYFRKSPYVVIYTDLVEAPFEWLIDNGYNEYHKPEKIKKVKQQIFCYSHHNLQKRHR